MKKLFFYFIVSLGGLLLSLVLILLVLLRTDWGHTQLERGLNLVLAQEELQIELNGLQGALPFDLQLKGLQIADQKGQWLQIQDLRLEWSLRNIFQRQVVVDKLSATELNLERPPHTEPDEMLILDDPAQEYEMPFSLPMALLLSDLTVDRIGLGQEFLGSKAQFALQAALEVDIDGDLRLDIDLQGLDRPDFVLKAAAEYTPSADSKMDMQLLFQDDGLLQDILEAPDLPRDSFLQLTGQGLESTWQGRLELKAPGVADMDSDLELDLQDRPRLQARGALQPARELIPDQFQDYVREEIDFLARAELNTQKDILYLEELQLSAPKLESRLQSRIDLQEASQAGDWHLKILDPAPFLAPSGVQADSLELQASFAGSFTDPEVQLQLGADQLRRADLSLDRLELDSEINLDLQRGLELTAKGTGRLLGLEQPGLSREKSEVDLDYSLQLQPDLRLKLPELQIRAAGDILQLQDLDLDLQNLELHNALLAFDIADLTAWLEEEQTKGLPSAALDLHAGLKGNFRDPELQMDFQGSLRDIAGLPAELLAISGSVLDFKAGVDVEQGQLLKVRQFEITGQEFALQAAGAAQMEQGQLQGTLDLDLPRLQALQEHLPVELQGGARLALNARGRLPDLDLDLELESSNLVLHQDQSLDLALELQARNVLQEPRGEVSLDLAAMEQQFFLQSGFAVQDKLLQLAPVKFEGSGANLSADLNLDLESVLLQGQFQGDVPDLSPLAALAGLDLQGGLKLQGSLHPEDQKQGARLDLDLQDFVADFARIQGLQTKAKISDLFQDPGLQGDFKLSDLQAGDLSWSRLSGDLNWSGQKLTLNAESSGHYLQPLNLDLGLEFTPAAAESNEHHLVFKKLEGDYGHKDFGLVRPLQLQAGPEKIVWQELDFYYGSGSLTSQGKLQAGEINGFARIKALNLQDLPVQQAQKLHGLLQGSFEFSGTGQEPRLQGLLQIQDLQVQELKDKDLSGLQMQTDIDYQQGQLSLEAETVAGQKIDSALVLDLPLELALFPFAADVDQTAPWAGDIQARMDLSYLSHLFLTAGQTLTGSLLIDGAIQGSMQQPDLQGQLQIQDGTFEQPAAGILVQDILLQAGLEGSKISIDQLLATDGRQGTLQGQGTLQMAFDQDLDWDMDLKFRDFMAVNSSEVQAWLDKGRINIAGGAAQSMVQGKLRFSRVQASIPEPGPADIVHLEYTEKNGQDQEKDFSGESGIGDAYALGLDLNLEFPARVYVRGRGLDSEWQGSLQVSGDVRSPELRGNLSVIRGHMMFLNKRFSLDEGSGITFTGASPPEPALDITARHRHQDLEGIVRVTGSVQDMQLELDSDPPLPQDEILARVLFGRNLGDITPFQAVMLANTARSMATGGGMDLMGQMRALLDVDTIDVQRDQETGEMQFGVGKYVHEKVYLMLETGSEPASDRVRVQVELTPRLSLESKLEAEQQSGLGLLWKMDY